MLARFRIWTKVLLLLFASTAYGQALAPPPPGQLAVYFFDVGQGDSALIISPAGKTVLIDGGPPEGGAALVQKLKGLVNGPLDLVVLSHPHLDHLGGLIHTLKALGAKRFLEPEFDHPTPPYRDLLKLVATRVDSPLRPVSGHADAPLTIGLGGGARLMVLWPRRPHQPFITETRSDANANSLVLRLVHDENVFLFTGDAEAETEQRLLAGDHPVSAKVLKVAHHGSAYSTQSAFLARVKPQWAVISCGAKNEYGHPAAEVVERLQSASARLFRTDRHGDVRILSDGKTLSATTTRNPDLSKPKPLASPSGFIASRKARVFHRAACTAAKRIKTPNRIHFKSRIAASRQRKPARDCHP